MMVLYSGTTLIAENYDPGLVDGELDRSHWIKSKETLRPKNALINLPYVIDGDVIVTQSNACLSHLGRKFGMLGANMLETSQCDQLLCEAMDLRNSIVGFCYGAGRDVAKVLGDMAQGGSLSKLNAWMEHKCAKESCDGTFFVGSSATAPDFHIWELLDQLSSVAKFYSLETPFASYAKLVEFYGLFRALPGNAAYFAATKLSQLPANNLMAQTFGATPSGHSWEAYKASHGGSEERPWINSSGTYN